MYDLQIETKPQSEPIAYGEVKHQLSISHDEDMAWIENVLIPVARQTAETSTHRQILSASWKLYLPRFPSQNQSIQLPLGRFQALGEVSYTDNDYQPQTINLADLHVHGGPDYSRVHVKTEWPQGFDVVVDWTCGYGESRDTVPHDLRHAMLLLVSHWYEQREDVTVGAIVSQIPNTSAAILSRNRLGDAFVAYDPTSQMYVVA